MPQEPLLINPFTQGPYIQAATFCDMVIEGKDGTLSLIRLIDTLTHIEQGPNPPMEMPPVHKKLKLVLMIKAGRTQGRHQIKITPHLPNGETKNSFEQSINLDGEGSGHNTVIDFNFQYELEGSYFFDVFFNEEMFTRIPLKVTYERFVTNFPKRP